MALCIFLIRTICVSSFPIYTLQRSQNSQLLLLLYPRSYSYALYSDHGVFYISLLFWHNPSSLKSYQTPLLFSNGVLLSNFSLFILSLEWRERFFLWSPVTESIAAPMHDWSFWVRIELSKSPYCCILLLDKYVSLRNDSLIIIWKYLILHSMSNAISSDVNLCMLLRNLSFKSQHPEWQMLPNKISWALYFFFIT